MICGWSEYTPATGHRLRSGRWSMLARIARQVRWVAKFRGYVTIFDDEVE